jgi:Uma2 family endonuclease
MSTTTNHTTAEELWQMADEPLELLRGKLIEIMSPAGGTHSKLMARLSLLVVEYVEREPAYDAFSGDCGFIFARNPDTVLGPDVALVSGQKLSQLDNIDHFLPVIPDVVFEIISVNDTFQSVDQKAKLYLEFGVPLAIVVNPRKRILRVHRAGEEVFDVPDGEKFDCDAAAPGLVIDTKWLFKVIE